MNMPHASVVNAFVARVEAGDFIGAIEDYYDAEVVTQENEATPKIGRETVLASERAFMAAMRSIVAERVAPPLIGDEHVAVRWRFTLTPREGDALTLDEIAFQTWRGDRIVAEKFFFDPKVIGR
jgi:ketosteroid isomerase-like protein